MKHLAIDKNTMVRLGFYGEPPTSLSVWIVEWLKDEGDVIEKDPSTGDGEIIVKLDSEKGLINVEATDDEIGYRINRILMKKGEKRIINLRDEPLLLAMLASPEDVASEEPRIRATPIAKRVAEEKGLPLAEIARKFPADTRVTRSVVEKFADAQTEPNRSPLAAPATRRLAHELEVDLTQVKPTGAGNIITERDVRNAGEIRPPEMQREGCATKEPTIVAERGDRGYEIVAPSIKRRGTAHAMTASLILPHAGDAVNVNPEPLFAFRNAHKAAFLEMHGVELRLDYFLGIACAYLLMQEEFRALNGYWHEEENRKEEQRLYTTVNMGIAVAVPRGPGELSSNLFVPNVKHAETFRLAAFAKEADRVIAAARSGTLRLADSTGTTFVVDNTGTPVEYRGKKYAGGESPEPLLAPQTSAIVAFGNPYDTVQGKRAKIAIRIDHRMVDGYEAITFLRVLQELIENPERILLL